MKGKAIIPLVLGLCIGLVALKFGVDAVRSAKAAGEQKGTVMAVRAVQDIHVGVAINEEMIELVETTPNAFLPERERVGELEAVVGRVTQKPISAGSAILLSALAPEGTSPGMPGRIPPGQRAVSVKIDEVSSVAFQIKPGVWVDVIVVMDIKDGRNKAETIAEVILQHVQVVAVGRALPTEGDGKTKSKNAKTARSATLLVAEEDVPKLHLAGTRGRLTLALRGDDEVISPGSSFAKLGELLAATAPDPEEAKRMDEIRKMEAQLEAEREAHRLSMMSGGEPSDVTIDSSCSVAIYRGSPSASGFSIQLITFEDDDSRQVVDASDGPRTGISKLLRSSSTQNSAQRVRRDRGERETEVTEEDDPSSGNWETE